MREELDNEAEGESELKSMEKVTGVATDSLSLSFSQPAIHRAESNTAAMRMNLLIVTSIKIA